MPTRRRATRGQAVVELALSAPVMVFLALGAFDLGRAYFYQLPVSAAASAGARFGAISATYDIGKVVRSASSVMPDGALTWGTLETSDCSSTSQSCGDPSGCASSSSFWTTPPAGQPDPVACFAVRTCTLDTSGSSSHGGQCSAPNGCTPSLGWSTRPAAGSAQSPQSACQGGAIQVSVVYRLVPITPLIGSFFSGPGNALFLTQTATVEEEY